jgi:hypothetical protein
MELMPEQRAEFYILGWDEQVLRGLRQLKEQPQKAIQIGPGIPPESNPLLQKELQDKTPSARLDPGSAE